MTTYSKATLKTFFEQGDVPTGTDYANLIDSQINIVEASQQNMGGALSTPELITPRISAANVNVTTALSAVSLYINGPVYSSIVDFNTAGDATVSAGGNLLLNAQNALTASASNSVTIKSGTAVTVSAGTGMTLGASSTISIRCPDGTVTTTAIIANIDAFNVNINAGGAILVSGNTTFNNNVTVVGNISASAASVYCSALRTANGVIAPVGIVSAAGVAQGTAAPLVNVINRCKGVVDGSTTGFAVLANRTGLTQTVYNDAVSANLWPVVGGSIGGAGSGGVTNQAFPMAANTVYYVTYITASACVVK